MASSDVVATSSATPMEESRQSGLLPSKRGEIGFIEGVHTQPPAQAQLVDQDTLPARHPADRTSPVTISDLPSESTLVTGSSIPSDSSSTNIVDKCAFRWNKKLPKFMGIQLMTLFLGCVQILCIAGTIIGWVFAARAMNMESDAPPPPPPPSGGQNPPSPFADRS